MCVCACVCGPISYIRQGHIYIFAALCCEPACVHAWMDGWALVSVRLLPYALQIERWRNSEGSDEPPAKRQKVSVSTVETPL